MNTHDFTVRAADGGRQDLRDYAGRVLLQIRSELEALLGG